MTPVAALYVEREGIYSRLPLVDAWDAQRDARRYRGPLPVVAHPPCERWGRYATGGPNPKARRREVGDDEGCFREALKAVRSWGGVLEHPAASKAWAHWGIPRPPPRGWLPVSGCGALHMYTCEVWQGHYGHVAAKPTWLLYVGREPPPSLMWGRAKGRRRLEPGFHSAGEAKAARADPGYRPIKRLTRAERVGTPWRFALLLVGMARRCRG